MKNPFSTFTSGLGGDSGRLVDPYLALPMAAALIGGGSNQESLSNAMMAGMYGMQARRDRKDQQTQRNQTVDYLNRNRPDLAEAYAAGVPMNVITQELFKKPDERKIMQDASGRQRFVDTGDYVFGDVGPDPKQAEKDFETEQKLRKEYSGLGTVKSFGEQTAAYQRVIDSARNPSPAGDLALIFNYMKVLDPGSVVRESEFATAAASGAFGDRIQAAYERIRTGKRLSEEQRRDFVREAGELFQGAAGLHGRTNEYYTGVAGQYGIDPTRIVTQPPSIGIMDPNWNMDTILPLTPEAGLPGMPGSDLPEGFTEEDVDFTMRKYGISREEVLRRMAE
ncbi:hypothetical protein AAFN47_18760 [Hoeflea sp. CAU 1731]